MTHAWQWVRCVEDKFDFVKSNLPWLLLCSATVLPFGTQKKSWRLESSLQGMGDEKAFIPRAPQGPAWHHHHHQGPRVRMTGQGQPGSKSHHKETRDLEPRGRAALLGSLTPLLSTLAPLSNKVSFCQPVCLLAQFISKCQMRVSGPGRGPPSCHRIPRGLGILNLNPKVVIKVCV